MPLAVGRRWRRRAAGHAGRRRAGDRRPRRPATSSPTRSSPTTPSATARCSSRRRTRRTRSPTRAHARGARGARPRRRDRRRHDRDGPPRRLRAAGRRASSRRRRRRSSTSSSRTTTSTCAAALLPPLDGLFSEAELHARLLEALGAMPGDAVAELRVAWGESRAAFREKFFALAGTNPMILGIAPALLYRAIGDLLPQGLAEAAAVWGLCQIAAQKNPRSLARAGFARRSSRGRRRTVRPSAHQQERGRLRGRRMGRVLGAAAHPERAHSACRLRALRRARRTGGRAGARDEPGLPLRPLGRRAALVHRKYDHAQS